MSCSRALGSEERGEGEDLVIAGHGVRAVDWGNFERVQNVEERHWASYMRESQGYVRALKLTMFHADRARRDDGGNESAK